jgi:probable F420-dependent oxidoreductase
MPTQFNSYLDPILALTFAAAHTERMRLGMSTLNALWYPPVLLARALTTLDVLSKGRLDAGFGISWLRDEYEAVNVPWEGRGARLDEMLDVLEKIWTSDVVEHQGPSFSIVPSTVLPKPVQRPHPPILLSAMSPGALRRVGRRGDGWLALSLPLPVLKGMLGTIREEAEAAGRDPAVLRTVLRINANFTDQPAPVESVPFAGTMEQALAYAREAVDFGVDEVLVDFGLMYNTVPEIIDHAGVFLTALRAG